MGIFKLLVLAFVFSIFPLTSVSAGQIKVACTDWAPYYFEDNGEIKGSGYEIAKMVNERAGVEAKYLIEPWKRVYETGLNEPDYMISCLGRTPEREMLFQWIGPITTAKSYYLYKLKSSSLTLGTPEAFSNYKVGVIRGGHQESFARQLGFKDIKLLTDQSALVKMLQAGRIDLVLDAEHVIESNANKDNIDLALFEKAEFAYDVAANLALSKNTSPEVVEKLQNAYKALSEEGLIILEE